MKPWADVEADPDFQALPPIAQNRAQEQYFTDVVAPQLSEEQLDPAKQQFFAAFGRQIIPQDTGQGLPLAMLSSAGRGLMSIPEGMVSGAGAVTSLVPGMDDNFLQRSGRGLEQWTEDVLPINPTLEDSFAVKAPSAVGQGVGFLGLMAGTGGLGATPAIARAVGLGTAGMMGAEQGEESADYYSVDDPWERAAMILGGGATEALTESIGGFGGGNWTRSFINRAKNAVKPGSAVTRFGKTAGVEGLEEIIAGEGHDQITKGIVEEDLTRPGFSISGAPLPPDTFTMENLYKRLEEGALGAIGGAVFGSADLIRGRNNVRDAFGLRMEANARIQELQSKPELTPQEQEELATIQAEDQNLTAWLERQGMDAVVPALDQIIESPDTSETDRSDAVQYKSLIDNLASTEADSQASEEEKEAAREAVRNHPLNGLKNPFHAARQNSAISGTFEDRQRDLQNRVREAARTQQGTAPTEPATAQLSPEDVLRAARQAVGGTETVDEPQEFNLSDFKAEDQIAEGSESAVYRQGDQVVKVGEAYNDPASFEPRVASILRGDQEIGSGNLKLAGYYTSANGVRNPVFSQPFIEGRSATQEEINAHMASRGFVPVPNRRMFVKQTPDGVIAASDLDGDNVKVTPSGQIEVIDATVFEPSLSPEIEAALLTPETSKEIPLTSDATQSQTSTSASLTPATAQAAASMGVQPETAKTTDPITDTSVPSQVTNETPTTVQEQPTLPADAAQQVPVAATPSSTAASGTGESLGALPASGSELTPPQSTETPKAKPARKSKVRLGIAVSPREVQRAVKKFQKISGFRIATVQELAEDENVRALFQTEEEWQEFLQNRLPFSEGLSHDGRGNIVVIPENLAIYDTDQARAKKLGTTAGEEAMIRVMMHEGWHGAERWIEHSDDPQAQALRKRYHEILNSISEEEMDDLARRRYQALSNWRNDARSDQRLRSEVLAERRELAELTGEPDSLVEKFLAWLRDVLKTVTGTQAEPTPDELQELFNAWYRAQKATQTRAGPVQQSLPEGIPPRPNIPVTYEDRGTGNILDEVLDSIWPQFYTAWASRQQEAGKPLDQKQLAKEWSERISDPDYLFDKDVELRIEKRNANRNWVDIQLPPRELTAPETGPRQTKRKASKTAEPTKENILRRFPQMSLPEMTSEERLARMAEIANRLSYTPSTEQQEGQTPAQATQDQLTYAEDGTPVEMYRQGVTGAEIDALSNEALDHAISLSPDGPSADFGKELVKYLNGQIPTLNGLPDNPFLKAAIAIDLERSPQKRVQMQIDGQDVRKAIQQVLSVAGRTLQAASQGRLYEPLRKMMEQAEEMTNKAAQEEIGTTDFKAVSDAGNTAKTKEVESAVDDLMSNMPVILEAAQNQADSEDFFQMGIESIDPKLAKKITELNDRLERLGRLQAMRKRLMGGQTGPAASLPEIPDNLTLAELDKLIAEETSAIRKLADEVEKAQKKATAKPREKKSKKKAANNASFYDYVSGKETAGLQPFVDLVKKHVQADAFNQDAFRTVLTNSFKEADPDFIQGVVARVAGALDGNATEDGLEEDLKKTAPNYDARAKRIVTTNLAKESSTAEEEDAAADPFVELTKQRLKGEISAKDYQEGLKKLGVEEQTAFAMLQKVDQDRARMADAEAQRQVTAEARKNMEKGVRDAEREAQKYEKEALREIESTSKQFDETAPYKEQRKSELKKLKDSFLGKEGPPITEEQFIEQAQALNIKPETAQKLASWLNASRRADAMDRYQKALRKAKKAKEKAVEAMVAKLKKVKNPTPKKLKQRSTFVNSLIGAMETGILDSDAVRAAFAEAYDLHGLSQERLKAMGSLLQEIEGLREGMVKETYFNEFNVLLNSIAPTASFVTHAHAALMGYVLSGASTMAMQLTGSTRFLNPLGGALEVVWTAPGTLAQKIGRTVNPKNFFRAYWDGLREMYENLPQVVAGMSGIVSSTPQGLGASPTSLASVTPRQSSLSYTPWGQLSKYRFNTPRLLKSMGLDGMVQLTRYPGWMVSRSFQVIRAAEGIVGGADKNMQWRAQMTYALMRQNPSLSFADAYSRVSDTLGDKTAELWTDAYKQADEEIAQGTVAKSSRKQRATELAQDKLEDQWKQRLQNRHRELSALYGYKQDPITPLGAWAYKGLSGFLNKDTGAAQYLKFSFLFARFFSNAIETAYSRTPLGGLTALAIDTSKSEGKMDEREKRIVQMFGSLQNYKDARMARAVSGTAVMGALAGLMAMALRGWDPDDDEPPVFWITGDPIGEFSKRGGLEAGGWWKANTLYMGPIRINYVNASPEMAMTMSAMGSMGDRFLFDKLLNYRENKETGEYERSNYEAYGKPVLEAMAAPISRSTFRQWYDMLDAAYDGNFVKITKAFSNPIVGTATALSPAAMIPSIKTLERTDRASEQPKSPQSPAQAAMGSVPFADELGLDAGKPLTTPFGQPLTPYPFWSVFSNTQDVPPEVGRAARLLTDLGVSRLGPREEYFGWGMAEIAHEGRKFLLNDEERSKVLQDIGTRFANKINANAPKLRKLEKEKDGRKKVRDEISNLAGKARGEALSGYKPKK